MLQKHDPFILTLLILSVPFAQAPRRIHSQQCWTIIGWRTTMKLVNYFPIPWTSLSPCDILKGICSRKQNTSSGFVLQFVSRFETKPSLFWFAFHHFMSFDVVTPLFVSLMVYLCLFSRLRSSRGTPLAAAAFNARPMATWFPDAGWGQWQDSGRYIEIWGSSKWLRNDLNHKTFE